MGRFHRHDETTGHSHQHLHADDTMRDHDHNRSAEHGDHDHSHDHSHDHGDHSGYDTGSQRVDVLESIFAENDTRAGFNREAFERNGIRALNLMSSPGSGQTTVLGAALDEFVGDIASGSSKAISPPTSTRPRSAAAALRCRCSTPATASAANAT